MPFISINTVVHKLKTLSFHNKKILFPSYLDSVLPLVEEVYPPDVVEDWVSRVTVHVVGDDWREVWPLCSIDAPL